MLEVDSFTFGAICAYFQGQTCCYIVSGRVGRNRWCGWMMMSEQRVGELKNSMRYLQDGPLRSLQVGLWGPMQMALYHTFVARVDL